VLVRTHPLEFHPVMIGCADLDGCRSVYFANFLLLSTSSDTHALGLLHPLV